MKKIIIIGSINMDIVSQVEKHPRPGETVKGKDFLYVPGGKGANQAVAAHRLGGDIRMLGKIGMDAFGEQLIRFFRKEGMDTGNIFLTDHAPTGAAFVAVDQKSENVIYVSGGANHDLSPSDTKQMEIEKGDLVSATLETPMETTKHFFSRAKKNGAKTILNAAPAMGGAETIFPFVDYLVVNEIELSVFARTKIPKKKSDAFASMRKLKTRVANIIVTLGKKGAIALIGDEMVNIQGHHVQAVDSTGAGDCFVGAFAVALQENKTIKQAMDFANAAAALSVQRLGASSSFPMKMNPRR